VPSSAEVLASPPPQRRPVLRAVLMALVVGLVVWAVVARLSEGDAETPAAAPPQPTPSSSVHPMPTGPPPWVRYPTPLEGRWVSAEDSGRLTLVIHNAYVDVWQGTGQQQGLPVARRTMVVVGDLVHIRPPGDAGEVATYRWRITGDRLTFELVDQTTKSASMLAGRTFERS